MYEADDLMFLWEGPSSEGEEHDFFYPDGSDSDDSEDMEIKDTHHRQRYLNHGLHYALETDRFDAVRMFLRNGADPNSASETNYCNVGGLLPLDVAAGKDNMAVFEYLLHHGANPRLLLEVLLNVARPFALLMFFAKHPKLFLPIIETASDKDFHGNGDANMFVVASILIRIDTKDLAEGFSQVLKHLVWLEKFDWLDPGVGIELISEAVNSKSMGCLKVLVERQTKIELMHDLDGQYTDSVPLHVITRHNESDEIRPLNAASANDDLEIVMFLLERGEMCTESGDGMLPIDYAYEKWATNVLRFFLLNGYTSKRIEYNQLHVACFLEDVALVKKLLKGGADVNMQDCHGRIALEISIKMKNVNLVKLLLESGIQEDYCQSGYSFYECLACNSRSRLKKQPCAIVTAAREGNAEILDLLLNSNPGQICTNSRKHDLLSYAIEANNDETFERLLQLGIGLDRIREGHGPVEMASRMGDYQMLKALFEHGATRPMSMLAECTDPSCIQLLLSHVDNTGFYYDMSETSVACLASLRLGGGNVEIIKAYGEEPARQLSENVKILELALTNGYYELLEYMLSQNPKLQSECYHLMTKIAWDDLKSFNNVFHVLITQGCKIDFIQPYKETFLLFLGRRQQLKVRSEMKRFAVNVFNSQFFVFIKIIQERCGRNTHEFVDWHVLLKILIRSRDLAMVTLLRDCGINILTDETLSETLIEKLLSNDAAGTEFQRCAEQLSHEPLSLQNQCRVAIRRRLFTAKGGQDGKISDTMQELPLPNCMKDFLGFTGQYEFNYLRYCA